MDLGRGWSKKRFSLRMTVFLKQNTNFSTINCKRFAMSYHFKVKHLLTKVSAKMKLLKPGISYSWHILILRIQSLIIILYFPLHCSIIENF